MRIQALVLSNFRNFRDITIKCSEAFTVIAGPNGSGKTSVLEAIYYLSRGRSLRTHVSKQMLRHGSKMLCVHACLEDSAGRLTEVGIQRDQSGAVAVRQDGQDCASCSVITEILPILLLDTDSHRVFASGPKHRRAFIDWGGFYHFADFAKNWRDYKRTLAQRNTALKARQNTLEHWDALLVQFGLKLNAARQQYLKDFEVFFEQFWSEIGQGLPAVKLNYDPGWPETQSLATALSSNRCGDEQAGFTRYGPHRADVSCLIGGRSVFEVLSQGEQKLMTYALSLAQGAVLAKHRNKRSVYLIDDLPAELDSMRRSCVISSLVQTGMQVFVTSIQKESIISELKDGSAYQTVDLSDICNS